MSDFKTILIEDSRIANITDKETIGVMSGASQSTFQNFPATSSSDTSIIWNIQIPSENIVIDRNLLMQSTITLTLSIAYPGTVSSNALVFDLGLTDALQAFPLNSLCLTQQMSINNTSLTINLKDVLPMLLNLYDRRKLHRYNSMCPSLIDSFYAKYSDSLGTLNNVLSGYNNMSFDESFVPRGAYPVEVKNVIHSFTYGGTTYYNDSLQMIEGTSNNLWKVVLQFTTTEPFFLSPWTNTNANNGAGLVGINNISCNFSIDSSCSRVFSTMRTYDSGTTITDANGNTINVYTPYITNISLGATADSCSIPSGTSTLEEIDGTDYTLYTDKTAGTSISAFQNSQLLFNFLSLQPESYSKISAKNVVPYMDIYRFLSNSTSSTSMLPFQTQTITSQSLQLSYIPDLILICVRKPMSSMSWYDSNSFLTINSISINFNNNSGILSSANQQQLFNISYRNGSGQTYYEFRGTARINYVGTLTSDGAVDYDYGLTGQGKIVSTTGSLLVLNPALDFNLPAYLTNGSIGQYNFQFTINVTNQLEQKFVPEICTVTLNSGIFTTQLGTSAVNVGLLTKEETLKTKEQHPTIDTRDLKNFTGGSLSNFGLTNVMKLFNKQHKFSNDDKVSEPIINYEAGSMSAGKLSGGRIKRHIR